MDTILVIVTLVSLGMAITMTFVAWRLIQEERRRSSARVVALSAAADEASRGAQHVARHAELKPLIPTRARERAAAQQVSNRTIEQSNNRTSERRRPIDVYIHPDHRPGPAADASIHGRSMFTATGEGPGRRFSFVAAVSVLAILLLGGALYAVNRVGGGIEADSLGHQPSAPLELMALHHLREGDQLSVRGRIRNPVTGSELTHVTAVVFLFDRGGTYIATGRAPIDLRALSPGQESGFIVALPSAMGVGRYRLSFRSDTGGLVPHIDKRDPPPLASSDVTKTSTDQ